MPCLRGYGVRISLLALRNIVPDGVTSPQADPLWDWAVLLLRLCELDLDAESLVGLCGVPSAPHCLLPLMAVYVQAS